MYVLCPTPVLEADYLPAEVRGLSVPDSLGVNISTLVRKKKNTICPADISKKPNKKSPSAAVRADGDFLCVPTGTGPQGYALQ